MDLPYMEDVRNYEFAPVHNDKVRPSEEQLEAVDGLIDAMMLAPPGVQVDEEQDQEDLLQTETMLNPVYQYLYSCMAHRATKPGLVLPDLPSHIRRMMAPPEEVSGEGTSTSLRRVGVEFPLEEVKKKKRGVEAEPEKNGKGEPKKRKESEGGEEASSQSVTEVGAANPVQDFEQLLKQGEALIPGSLTLHGL
jgi:ATP-dependent DNA helicase 2 subunit 2